MRGSLDFEGSRKSHPQMAISEQFCSNLEVPFHYADVTRSNIITLGTLWGDALVLGKVLSTIEFYPNSRDISNTMRSLLGDVIAMHTL